MRSMNLMFLVLMFQNNDNNEATPRFQKFNFEKPQLSSNHRSENVQHLAVETAHEVDMRCRNGELQSFWIEKKSSKRIVSPFIAQTWSAGEYKCPAKTVHLTVVDPLNFSLISTAQHDDDDVRAELLCAVVVHAGRQSVNLTLSVYYDDDNDDDDDSRRTLGTKAFTTDEEGTSRLALTVEAKKQTKAQLSFEEFLNSFSCAVDVVEPLESRTIFTSRRPVALKLYSRLKNVRPNATKAAAGQVIQCLSEGSPAAHRYAWKYYEVGHEGRSKKPSYIAAGHVLKIFDAGNHSFVCTAFNMIGKKEHGLSWVGNLLVVGERKLEARSIGKWVAGGVFATVVVLVAVVSYARS